MRFIVAAFSYAFPTSVFFGGFIPSAPAIILPAAALLLIGLISSLGDLAIEDDVRLTFSLVPSREVFNRLASGAIAVLKDVLSLVVDLLEFCSRCPSPESFPAPSLRFAMVRRGSLLDRPDLEIRLWGTVVKNSR